jgi:hypothetical protein
MFNQTNSKINNNNQNINKNVINKSNKTLLNSIITGIKEG